MDTFSALLALCERNPPVTVDSPHKGQWRGALMFFYLRPNTRSANTRDAGDLRRHPVHYDVTLMEVPSDLAQQFHHVYTGAIIQDAVISCQRTMSRPREVKDCFFWRLPDRKQIDCI